VGERQHPNCDLVGQLYAAHARDDRDTVRAILADDVRWHDPYPPPHGGDLAGADTHALAWVDWSARLRGERMAGTEGAVYRIADGRVVEAWFFPEDLAASDAFFEGGIDG
jgi:ketosteroid isomerase-like protein